MSNESGQGNDPNTPSGDQPYKSFGSEDEFKTFQSKAFSQGYNDMQSKAVSKIAGALGEDVSDLDTALEKVKSYKQKVAESVSDPTATDEYKQLQSTVDQWKQKAEEATQQATHIKNQYKVDSTFTKGSQALKEAGKFKIPEDDVKALFMAKHDIEFKDDKDVVRKGDQLLMDDSGNPKSLEKAFIDFSKSYIEPATDGAGGGSGDGGGAKPKFADFKAASKANNRDRQSKLLGQAKQAGGWAEPDAPAV